MKSIKDKWKMDLDMVLGRIRTVILQYIVENFTKICDKEEGQWIMAISTNMKGYGRMMWKVDREFIFIPMGAIMKAISKMGWGMAKEHTILMNNNMSKEFGLITNCQDMGT